MERKYEFYDTFKKSCEFKNGTGECHKTRESKRCINDKCEIIKIPMKKKEILNDYYSQILQGSGYETQFTCPFCNKDLPISNLIQHIKTHLNESSLYKNCNVCNTNMIGSGRGQHKNRKNIMNKLHKKWWYKNKDLINSEHFP